MVNTNSDLAGRTLKGVDFRNRFGATALAVRRHGEDIREKVGHVRLQVGDELLVLVPRRNLPRLRSVGSFLIMQEIFDKKICFKVIGKGSNLLFRDRGFNGVILSLAGDDFQKVSLEKTGICTGPSASSKKLLSFCRKVTKIPITKPNTV